MQSSRFYSTHWLSTSSPKSASTVKTTNSTSLERIRIITDAPGLFSASSSTSSWLLLLMRPRFSSNHSMFGSFSRSTLATSSLDSGILSIRCYLLLSKPSHFSIYHHQRSSYWHLLLEMKAKKFTSSLLQESHTRHVRARIVHRGTIYCLSLSTQNGYLKAIFKDGLSCRLQYRSICTSSS